MFFSKYIKMGEWPFFYSPFFSFNNVQEGCEKMAEVQVRHSTGI
jgi:hypothetical protein